MISIALCQVLTFLPSDVDSLMRLLVSETSLVLTASPVTELTAVVADSAVVDKEDTLDDDNEEGEDNRLSGIL